MPSTVPPSSTVIVALASALLEVPVIEVTGEVVLRPVVVTVGVVSGGSEPLVSVPDKAHVPDSC